MPDAPPLVSLPNTETHLLQSSFSDQRYQVFVSLPEDYAESKEAYPVVYVTDGNWFFGTFHAFAPLYPIPEVIIVGVGYPPEDDDDLLDLRSRDFLPTKGRAAVAAEKDVPAGGGGDFLSFFREDLFPFIEARYRTKPDDRTLWGFSYGGTFGIYTLFTQPDTFKRYIIGAPTLVWDDRICFAYEREYAERANDLAARLYFWVGTLDEDLIEHNASQLFEFHSILQRRNYASLKMDFGVFAGETHMTGVLPGLSWGLRSVFG